MKCYFTPENETKNSFPDFCNRVLNLLKSHFVTEIKGFLYLPYPYIWIQYLQLWKNLQVITKKPETLINCVNYMGACYTPVFLFFKEMEKKG